MKSATEIIQDIKRKIYHPVYFLSGEEPYYVDQISDFIEDNLLSPEERDFNQTVVYGRDIDVQGIIDYCKRFPMMSDYQVVIVKEAQVIKNIEELSAYVENPLSTTILVICYKYAKIDKRKSFAKLIEKKTVFYESPKIWENQMPAWITNFFKGRGYPIQQKAAYLMAEFLGTELGKIVNEAEKLMINVKAGTEITVEHVERNIGISKDYNVFELQKALGAKNVFRANQIIKYFADNEKENPMVKVLPLLYSYFSKVLLYHNIMDKSPNNLASSLSVSRIFVDDYAMAARNYPVRKLRNVFSFLHDYDLKAKGIDSPAVEDGELMKEMIFKILN
ncbi:MAG: DNA polymerase III subunit delta [Bacteroidales bacterium]|jgi:DNA polymerase-3 subunit delta|nr:DNA polymerase III subunit delta [Bacteroidales bacterium]MDD4213829.1 DNA polymerase III subunit delta [Bacteroidales bacterium]